MFSNLKCVAINKQYFAILSGYHAVQKKCLHCLYESTHLKMIDFILKYVPYFFPGHTQLRAHVVANLDPLGIATKPFSEFPSLDPSFYHFGKEMLLLLLVMKISLTRLEFSQRGSSSSRRQNDKSSDEIFVIIKTENSIFL